MAFSATLNVNDLNGNDGFIATSTQDGDFFGGSVRGIIDINGDSINDLIISADNNNTDYAIFGRGINSTGFPSLLQVSGNTISNGSAFPDAVNGFGDVKQRRH